ncbi:hypothetical protein pb186bvf_010784 [Paramecium bursaria]
MNMTLNQPIHDAYLHIQSLFNQVYYSHQTTSPLIIHNLQKALNRCVEDLHDLKKQCDEHQELFNTTMQCQNQENKNNGMIQPSQMSQYRQQHQFPVQDINNSVNGNQSAKLAYPSFLNQTFDQDQPSIQKLNQSISLEKQAHQNNLQTQPKIKIINQSDNTHTYYNNQPQLNQSFNESFVKLEQQKKTSGLAYGQTTLNFGQVQKQKATQGENEQNLSSNQMGQYNEQNIQEKQQGLKKKIQKNQNKQKGDNDQSDCKDKKDQIDKKNQKGQKIQKVKKNQKSSKEFENKQKSCLDEQNSTNQVELLEWRRKLVDENHTFSFSKKYISDSAEKQKQDIVSRFGGIKLEEGEKPQNQDCLLCSNSPRKFNEQTVKSYDGDKEIWVHPNCFSNATMTNNQIDYYNKHSKICGVCNQNGAFHKCQHCNQNYHWPCLQNNKGMIGCQCPLSIFNQK